MTSMQGDEGQAGGVDAAAERLQQVATQKEGSGEELVALFVAIMRSVGLLARTVRCAAALSSLCECAALSVGIFRGPSRHCLMK